jgi:hypothetical protein
MTFLLGRGSLVTGTFGAASVKSESEWQAQPPAAPLPAWDDAMLSHPRGDLKEWPPGQQT